MKPPTKDLNVTAALALMSIVLVEAAGIRKKGVGGWIKSFTEPIAIVTPINILEVFIKPLSLCMRLFGNVLGAFVIMELLKLLVPVALPVPFSFYFDIFELNSHPSFPFCKRVSHFESDLQILYPTFHFCNDFPVFFLAFMI